MNYRRIGLDQMPAALRDAAGQTLAMRARLEETEHNVEDLLLCMQALRADDVPPMSWSWNENAWHPEHVNDEHYPQYFLSQAAPPVSQYHAIWSAPLCKRSPAREWHDAPSYLEGRGRQVLLFDYQMHLVAGEAASDPPVLVHDSICVVMGMHEGMPPRTAFASTQGNKLRVDVPLLVRLTQWIDELKEYLRLEKQVASVLERRAQRHERHNLHTNE